MTSSAPRDRTRSAWLPLHTPVTVAPSATASWTAIVPTAPDAPTTSTRWPGWTWPWSHSACMATNVGYGRAGGRPNDRPGGFGATLPIGATAYSANVPRVAPYTSAPGSNPLTS